MAKFYVLPTSDIHLILDQNIVNGDEFHLKFRLQDTSLVVNSALILVDNQGSQVISVTNNLSNATNPHLIIKAQTVGKAFIRITNDNKEECIVRVWVHSSIDSMWIGNNQISIHRGAKYPGYVLSIFAKFTDGEIGEITYHPFVSYSEVGSTYLAVSDHIIKSPATAIGPDLQTKIKITVGGLEEEVNVIIRDLLEAKREILEKNHVGTSTSEHRNLLILGEGFQSKQDFELYRDALINGLKNDNLFSPWHLIKENFTIWSAFESTYDPKEGITIDNPVNIIDRYMPDFYAKGTKTSGNFYRMEQLIEIVGIPDQNSPQTYSDAINMWASLGISGQNLTQDIFNQWLEYNSIKGYIENKDTVLGLSLGNRLGDKVSSSNELGRPLNNWYRPVDQQRYLQFDRRRYPTKDHIPGNYRDSVIQRSNDQFSFITASPFDEYLGSLKYLDAKIPNPEQGPEYNIGNTWQFIGKDNKLVAIICNHYKWAGVARSNYYEWKNQSGVVVARLETRAVMSCLSDKLGYNITSDPNINFKLSDNVSAALNFSSYDPLSIGGLFAHELMHAFGLKDEYEGNSYRTMPSEAQAEELDGYANVTSLSAIILDGTTPVNKFIDADKIKWNLLRVALSSMIVSDVTRSGSNLTLQVEPQQSAKWKKVLEYKDINNNPVVLPLYIRSSVYDKVEKKLFYEIAIEKIVSVNTSTETIVLKVNDSDLNKLDITKLKKGSHIYLPKRLGDDYDPTKSELFVINPRVFEYLKMIKKSFAISNDCSIANDDPEFPVSDSVINSVTTGSNYPEFSSPKNRFLVSGVYEGGAEWNCSIFRGNGWSVLRGNTLTFNDLSKVKIENGGDFDTDTTYTKGVSPYETALYARFDFIAKYYAVVVAYPTKLEDLDRLEYKDSDSTIL